MVKPYRVFSRKIVHKNPWYQVVKENIRYPSGHRGNYYVWENPRTEKGFVVAIAEDKDTFFLVKQWRPTLKHYTLEFVAGDAHKNEKYVKAAKRELLEELGLQAKRWQFIGKAAVAPGYSREYGRVFLATGISKSAEKAKGEAGEKTELVKIKRQKFEQMIYNREIEDGPTLSAYLLYLTRKKKNQILNPNI